MKKPAANPVSDADCKLFDASVLKWQKVLNLSDWRIERGSNRADKKNMAEVLFDPDARLATYRIGESFGPVSVSPMTLDATACHEMLHVLLYDLINASADARDGVEHRVINVLEKILMKAADAN